MNIACPSAFLWQVTNFTGVTKLTGRPVEIYTVSVTASLHKLAAGRKLATTHLNVSNRQMCGCTGFKSGGYNKSYYNRPFKNDTGL